MRAGHRTRKRTPTIRMLRSASNRCRSSHREPYRFAAPARRLVTIQHATSTHKGIGSRIQRHTRCQRSRGAPNQCRHRSQRAFPDKRRRHRGYNIGGVGSGISFAAQLRRQPIYPPQRCLSLPINCIHRHTRAFERSNDAPRVLRVHSKMRHVHCHASRSCIPAVVSTVTAGPIPPPTHHVRNFRRHGWRRTVPSPTPRPTASQLRHHQPRQPRAVILQGRHTAE